MLLMCGQPSALLAAFEMDESTGIDLRGVSKAWSCSTLEAGLLKLGQQPQPASSMSLEPGLPCWVGGFCLHTIPRFEGTQLYGYRIL